ncbi:MAG TPA: N-acetyl-gamma-glutamyl-phosphate reductase [bacterium]|nr:N-acetyl-gamma-glutamyl-phosphate reductase [bacterium]
MVRVGIFGISGYAGQKLVEILLSHPEAKITEGFVSPERGTPEISDIIPKVKNIISLKCENRYDWKKIKDRCDFLFLALPHAVSMKLMPDILSIDKKVVDLSADFRFKNLCKYEEWYAKHACPEYLDSFVYGLPEMNRNDIKKSINVANPGCYPTSIILALMPLAVKKLIKGNIIADSKSGVTGAGRSLKLENIFAECNENMKAYKVGEHRHTPEVEEILSCVSGEKYEVTFVPHLVPFNQGILSTCYVNLKKPAEALEIQAMYENFYRDEPFVRIMNYGTSPAVKNVANTNFCDIGLKVVRDRQVVIISALDNLIKGASGQAVHNMNLMMGIEETIPFFRKH